MSGDREPYTVEVQARDGTSGVIARCWTPEEANAAIKRVDLESSETLTLWGNGEVLCILGYNLELAGSPAIPF